MALRREIMESPREVHGANDTEVRGATKKERHVRARARGSRRAE
jgi:hypothetical protein